MTKLTVERVKKSLQPFVGCEIELDVNIGRNRIVNHKGELESIYKNVFVVKVEDHDERRLSFNYVDLMTGNVVVVPICGNRSKHSLSYSVATQWLSPFVLTMCSTLVQKEEGYYEGFKRKQNREESDGSICR